MTITLSKLLAIAAVVIFIFLAVVDKSLLDAGLACLAAAVAVA